MLPSEEVALGLPFPVLIDSRMGREFLGFLIQLLLSCLRVHMYLLMNISYNETGCAQELSAVLPPVPCNGMFQK